MLLVEIGTEELPPLSLTRLSEAFVAGVMSELTTLSFEPEAAHRYASPRRLAVLVERVRPRQTDTTETLRGPPLRIALDEAGQPSAAGIAFAEKCGVAFAALERLQDKKGEYLALTREIPGRALADVLGDIVASALATLPIARPMRWGEGAHAFVRPVHWIAALVDDQPVPIQLFGQTGSNATYGHRFHAPGPIALAHASDYASRLEHEGYVLADPGFRRERIRNALTTVFEDRDADLTIDETLLDEVSALVEWPVAIVGRFDRDYLQLPREVLISTLKKHQRYFPVANTDGTLRPEFVTISNLASRDAAEIARGNERVVAPRLADAAFFFAADTKTALIDRVGGLDNVVFETQLGSLGDKTRRVIAVTRWLCEATGGDVDKAERVALLSRADLTSDMVGEFPDLQGIMGRYYAAADGETEDIATAIGDFYRPAFAGDAIPQSELGRIVALADRADTLAGVFAVGKKPKGNKDPFGLRRAALGLARVAIEGDLSFALDGLFQVAVAAQPVAGEADLAGTLYTFVIDRLRAHILAARTDVTGEIFDAVAANQPQSLVDFMARLDAVVGFAGDSAADALAAANKRIANLLRKSAVDSTADPDAALFAAAAEHNLHAASTRAATAAAPLLAQREYAGALALLAELRDPIDRFFEEVMVMADDVAIRDNRLALLASIRRSFLAVADISVLSRAR